MSGGTRLAVHRRSWPKPLPRCRTWPARWLAAGAAAARAAQLRELQASLPAGVQTARNGPYLVTNGPISGPRSASHCRCRPRWRSAAAAVRPASRSATAPTPPTGSATPRIPNRVPDRRDTYDGEQVTIFDNRGICQHSGLCSDRLSTVFRASPSRSSRPAAAGWTRSSAPCATARPARSAWPSTGPARAAEERDLADWHGRREPAIEITQDGPYRITGRIALSGADGEDIARAEGSSREHYALCRCGHSQNKPFCSGMHWYIGFTDPARRPAASRACSSGPAACPR